MSQRKSHQGLKHRLRDAPDKQARAAILDRLPHERGFGKPPVETQFKRGNQFGKGRNKGSKNFETLFDEAFAETVEVTTAGKKRRLSKDEIGLRQLSNHVTVGNLQALKLYVDTRMKLSRRYDQIGVDGDPPASEARPTAPSWLAGVDVDRLGIEELIEFRDLAVTLDEKGQLALTPQQYARLQALVARATGERTASLPNEVPSPSIAGDDESSETVAEEMQEEPG